MFERLIAELKAERGRLNEGLRAIDKAMAAIQKPASGTRAARTAAATSQNGSGKSLIDSIYLLLTAHPNGMTIYEMQDEMAKAGHGDAAFNSYHSAFRGLTKRGHKVIAKVEKAGRAKRYALKG